MTPEQANQERRAFEAWAKSAGLGDLLQWHDEDENEYAGFDNCSIDYAFTGWTAKAKQNGWIDANDRLPEEHGIYLVAFHYPNQPGKTFVTVRHHPNCFTKPSSNYLFDNDEELADFREIITHWQPLPAPPEIETKEGAK
ncbi:MAG: DUF551 domain-containing protein [Neisseria sp.]|nr:DUF551 domain-containing protein [Neisseria sp.]